VAETNSRRGLGRGISALMGESEPLAGPVAAETVREAPIELLRRNPDQPRRHFEEADLEELTNSIREKGILQPILVRPAPGAPGEYQIVAGERRWRAAQRAGVRSIPVTVRELNDLDVLEIGLIENVQRADLNALEEASAYKALIERFGRTQEAVAQAVGKSRSHIANSLRLLSLPEPVREHLMAGRLSAGHARAIASAPDPNTLAKAIVDRDLSVRQAEALARQAQGERSAPVRSRPRTESSDTAALAQDLSDALGLKIEIADKGGRGEILIKYRNLDQLDDLCRRLSGG